MARERTDDETTGPLQVTAVHDFSEEETVLRTEVTGNWDKNHYPYFRSKITLERMNIDELHPIALYVLNENLAFVRQIHRLLLSHSLNIFQLRQEAAIINYLWEGKPAVISPPIVEISVEDGNIPVIIDGLHRIFVARSQGRKTITVVKIENAAAPIPAFPVRWDEVIPGDDVPAEKRRYRFNTMAEVENWIRLNKARYDEGYRVPPDILANILRAHPIPRSE